MLVVLCMWASLPLQHSKGNGCCQSLASPRVLVEGEASTNRPAMAA